MTEENDKQNAESSEKDLEERLISFNRDFLSAMKEMNRRITSISILLWLMLIAIIGGSILISMTISNLFH